MQLHTWENCAKVGSQNSGAWPISSQESFKLDSMEVWGGWQVPINGYSGCTMAQIGQEKQYKSSTVNVTVDHIENKING